MGYRTRMINIQRHTMVLALALWPLLGVPPSAMAGEAQVVKAKIHAQGEHRYRFDVTLRHADDGWDHYADRWDVLSLDGTVLGVRVLAHPHVNEQPFTRSLAGVVIPGDTEFVIIRAHDSVHGDSTQTLRIALP